MKSFLEKSKRALVLLLTGAMIATSVPADVFAAPLATDEDVIFEEGADAVEALGATDEAVIEEATLESESDGTEADNTYEDTNLWVTGTRTNVDLVILSGDSQVPIANSAAGYTAAKDTNNHSIITAEGSGTPSQKIDSVNGFVGYVVPAYGYKLPENVAITVTARYTENGTPVDIPSSAWSVSPVATDLSYLDADYAFYGYGYEWKNAIEVKINGSEFLKKFAASASKNYFLNLDITATAVANPVPLTVTVDGVNQPGFKRSFSAAYSVDTELTDAVKAADASKYNLAVKLLDKNNDVYEGGTFTAATTNTASNLSTGSDNVYFYDATAGIRFNENALQNAYYEIKENGAKLSIEFTSKDITYRTITLDEDDFVTVKEVSGTEATAGTKIEEAAGAVKVVDGSTSDVVFSIVPSATGTGREITSVKYFMDGSAKGMLNAERIDDSGDIEHETGSSFSSGDWTLNRWVIPVGTHTGLTTETAITGNITIFIGTTDVVTYDLGANASGKSAVTVIDPATVATAASTDVSPKPTSVAVSGDDYVFSATPLDGYKIDSVTAQMIATASGTNYTATTVKEVGFGMYKIENVTGAIQIKIKTSATATDTFVTATGFATVREKTTGMTIGTNTEAAELQKPFTFVVTPDSGKAIKKVEYTMGETVKEMTEIPVNAGTQKADGSREYTISSVSGGITIKVTTVTGHDITKVPNEDAILTYNGEVIEDYGTIRASVEEDLVFTVAAATGAEIDSVNYKAAGTTTAADVVAKTYKLNATGSTFTIGKSSITSDSAEIVIATKRNADESTYTAKVDSSTGSKTNISELALKAGGAQITTASGNPSIYYAGTTLTTTFYNKNNVAMVPGAQSEVEYKLTKTGTAAVGAFTNAKTNPATFTTTKTAGEDTLTVTLTDRNTNFPQFVVYSKTIPVKVDPLNTLFDKVELGSVVTASPSTNGISATGSVIRVDSASAPLCNDDIVYSVYPYTTKASGRSTKDSALDDDANQFDGVDAKNAVTSITWTTDPSYNSTTITKPFKITSPDAATAKIEDATQAMDVVVTATLNFADGSTLQTDAKTLNIVKKNYGYFAIPTIEANGSSILNGTFVTVETKGSMKTATVKWDVYEITSAT